MSYRKALPTIPFKEKVQPGSWKKGNGSFLRPGYCFGGIEPTTVDSTGTGRSGYAPKPFQQAMYGR